MNAERDFLIREAQKNDLEAILAINNYVIQTSTSNYDWDIKELAWQKNWFQEKQIGNWPVFVVESEGRTVGFGTYGPFRLKQGYAKTVEHTIYIAEGFQSKGFGGALLEQLINTATKNGFHIMIAGIDADNDRSISFHQDHGFETVALFKEVGFKFNRWLDLVFMQLDLSRE